MEQPIPVAMAAVYPTIESTVGNTPLVRLQRLGTKQIAARNNVVLCKLEGAAPVISVFVRTIPCRRTRPPTQSASVILC